MKLITFKMVGTSFENFSYADTGSEEEDLTVFSIYLLSQVGGIYVVGPIVIPNHVYSDSLVLSLSSAARQLQASTFSRLGTKAFTQDFVEPLLQCLSRPNSAYCTGFVISEEEIINSIESVLPKPRISRYNFISRLVVQFRFITHLQHH